MLSKLTRLGQFLQNKRIENSLSQIVKRKFSQKVGGDQIFVNETQFVKKDQMLLIYESKEGTFFRGFSVLLGGLMSYNIYSYFSNEDEDEKDSSLLLSFLFGTTFLMMQWKINKTIKHAYLDANGRTIYLDFFKHAAFGNELIQSETFNMGGYNYFIHQYTQIPIFKYRFGGKKRFGFLKWSQAINQDILKNIFQKKTFVIGDNEIISKMSNSYKKRQH